MFKNYRVNSKYLECLHWNLTRVRCLMGLTQADLSDMLGISRAHYCNIENAKWKMRPCVYLAMVKLCEEFYETEDPAYSQIIEHELIWDFTEKRPKFKKNAYTLEEIHYKLLYGRLY